MDDFKARKMTEEGLNTEQRKNIIVRLWKGHVQLWKTYWLYGVLAGLIIRLLTPVVAYEVSYNVNSLSPFDVYLIIIWLLAERSG